MYKINNNEIKVIITDYDGSLRPFGKNTNGTRLPIPQGTVSAINDAIQNGCHFIINTGNLPYELIETVKLWGEITNQTKYIIGCNGNGIKNYLTNEVFVETSFNKESLIKFIEIFKKIGDLSYDITSLDLEKIYYSSYDLMLEMIGSGLNKDDKFHRLQLTDEVLQSFGECPKITLKRIPLDKKETVINDILKEFKHLNIYATWFMENGADFQLAGPSKFTGILRVLDLINQETNQNLTINNVVYFGDQMNDISCFENLPYAIALDNAIPEIKSLAYAITTSVEDNGIGNYLEKISY